MVERDGFLAERPLTETSLWCQETAQFQPLFQSTVKNPSRIDRFEPIFRRKCNFSDGFSAKSKSAAWLSSRMKSSTGSNCVPGFRSKRLSSSEKRARSARNRSRLEAYSF